MTEIISITLLDFNKGQLAGLPKNPRFFRDYRSIELSVLAIVSIVAEVQFIIIKTIRNMAGDEDKTQMWKQMGHSVFNNLMYLCIVADVFWM